MEQKKWVLFWAMVVGDIRFLPEKKHIHNLN
jgi:hypothetical protein